MLSRWSQKNFHFGVLSALRSSHCCVNSVTAGTAGATLSLIKPIIMSANLVKHTGGCHCGKVKFEVQAKAELRVYDCNCTICVKKGMKPFLIPKENFKLLQGEDNLGCYTFNTHQAKHFFCKTCGVHSFYYPRTNPNGCGISLYCLDEGTVKKADIIPCDALDWSKWQKYLEENPKAANMTENIS